MRFTAAILCLMTLGAACQTPSQAQRLPKSLHDEALPFPEAMNQAYFRTHYTHLSEEQFSSKWTGSLKSPLLFFRSYVNTWYAEVAALGVNENIGPCFGDPHPENFGYLWFGEDTFQYYFNDLDDSGVCPVAYDALRYFTALRLYWNNPSREVLVLKAYLAALSDQSNTNESALTELQPKLSALLKRVEDKYFQGDRLKPSPVVLAMPVAEQTKIFSVAKAALNKASGTPSEFTMLDVAQVVIKSGGSGGLLRYSLLIRDSNGRKQLVEMKEMTNAATDWGGWTTNPDISRSSFMALAWDEQTPRYFAFTKFQGKDFVVRSRIKSDPDLKDLKEDAKLRLFSQQAKLMAKVHRLTLKDPEALGLWLTREIDKASERYREAYEKAKTNAKN